MDIEIDFESTEGGKPKRTKNSKSERAKEPKSESTLAPKSESTRGQRPKRTRERTALPDIEIDIYDETNIKDID